MASEGGPRRRVTDHHHPEYWAREDHWRFEERVANELAGIRRDVEKLSGRLTLLLGGIAILAFLIPIVVPVIRDLLNIPAQVIP